jgi:DNA-binding transcriptional regulator YiaG
MSDGKLRPLAKCLPGKSRETYERLARDDFRAMRRMAGLSQRGFATAHKCDRSAVEDWERGVSRVPGWALRAAEEDAFAVESPPSSRKAS